MKLSPGIPKVTVLLPTGGRIELLAAQLVGDQPAHYRILEAGGKEWLVPATSVLVVEAIPIPEKVEESSPAEANGVAQC